MNRSRALFAILSVCLICAIAAWAVWRQGGGSSQSQFSERRTLPHSVQGPPEGQPSPLETSADAILPLTEDEARLANEKLPFSSAPIEQALPIRLDRLAFTPEEVDKAIACLTDAIYYEAGFEPDQGKRAVAQVILNRVRHPAYPSAVCDVVYEGSKRRTGCQFTFTCDGSTRRPPVPSAWLAAKRVATNAVNGSVEPSVGMATHYHANYVVPYWAKNLAKIDQVGEHIFYRWKGNWGRRVAFTLRPVPDQIEPALAEIGPSDPEDLSIVQEVVAPPPLPIENTQGTITATDGRISTGPERPVESDRRSGVLRADERSGTLKVDSPAQ